MVAVQNGSSEQQYLIDYYVRHGSVSIPYTSYQLALSDLADGKVDSVFVDRAVASEWLQHHADFSVVGNVLSSANYFGRGFGIAVSKDNPQLLKQFNSALTAIHQSGEYQKIYDHYFSDK